MSVGEWDYRFLELAELIATWSKDPSTKCGAVITRGRRIVSLGFNGFPAGTDDHSALYADREEKYRRVLHAEDNAMAFAEQSLAGCTCYVWPLPPCSQCAAMLIQRGITRVVTVAPTPEQLERWGASLNSAFSMFEDAGVGLEMVAQ